MILDKHTNQHFHVQLFMQDKKAYLARRIHTCASEVWIKIGGDKGGGTFKMNFQIVNIATPNSVHNSCVFFCFAAAWGQCHQPSCSTRLFQRPGRTS